MNEMVEIMKKQIDNDQFKMQNNTVSIQSEKLQLVFTT